MCVKLAARFLKENADAHLDPAFIELDLATGGSGELRSQALLLAPSASLVDEMARELDADMRDPRRPHHVPTVVRDPGGQWATVEPCTGSAKVHIMTVDALYDNLYPGDLPPLVEDGQFSLVVVDEGHMVFAHEADEALDGQHRWEDSTHAREAVTRIATGGIVVFHDQDYQHAGSKPVYPAGALRVRGLLPIVRNPNTVTDFSVSFSKALNADGDHKFFRRLNEGGYRPGTSWSPPAVQLVPVRELRNTFGQKTAYEFAKFVLQRERQGKESYRRHKSRAQTVHYGGFRPLPPFSLATTPAPFTR